MSYSQDMPQLKQGIYKYRDAFNRLGTFVAISKDFRFEAAADGIFDLFGYTEEDLFGKHISELDFAGSESILLKQMSQYITAGKTWVGDVTCRHKNGTAVGTRISIAPSFCRSVIDGYVAQYQKSYVQSNAHELSDVLYRYRSGFNKIAALAIVSSEGVIQEVNELFVEMYGFRRDEVIGLSISSLKSNSMAGDVYPKLWETVRTGKIWSGEIANRHKSGREIFIRCTAAPATDAVAEGVTTSFDAFLFINQDITQEHELRMHAKDHAIEAARQSMLSRTIHNIGNLQTSLIAANNRTIGATESLVAACAQADAHYMTLPADAKADFAFAVFSIVQKTSGDIHEAAVAERIAIDDTSAILEAFRRERNNERLANDESIVAFVQQSIRKFSLHAAQHHISICIDTMTEMDVQWPTAQVHQIVFNLLLNAQQAITARMLSGEIPDHSGRIDLSVVKEGEFVVFCVKDNGGGFHVSHDQLFSPQFTTKLKGTGIGLHTSAVLAQSMGGRLLATNSSIDGKPGAHFTLMLPQKVPSKTQNSH